MWSFLYPHIYVKLVTENEQVKLKALLLEISMLGEEYNSEMIRTPVAWFLWCEFMQSQLEKQSKAKAKAGWKEIFQRRNPTAGGEFTVVVILYLIVAMLF